jgi:hypothetical protein
MTEMRNAYTFSIGKPVETRPVRRPRLRWENNIKTDLKGIGSVGGLL